LNTFVLIYIYCSLGYIWALCEYAMNILKCYLYVSSKLILDSHAPTMFVLGKEYHAFKNILNHVVVSTLCLFSLSFWRHIYGEIKTHMLCRPTCVGFQIGTCVLCQ